MTTSLNNDQQVRAATAKAKALWTTFNKSERAGVRFGMFPARIQQEPEDQHALVIALMDCAKANGGMIG